MPSKAAVKAEIRRELKSSEYLWVLLPVGQVEACACLGSIRAEILELAQGVRKMGFISSWEWCLPKGCPEEDISWTPVLGHEKDTFLGEGRRQDGKSVYPP
ncbi:hypothetical protein Y1Q_0021344 [Alligator mississippiensis]|uniref:Uncharacterized protein n=1 Tax=Alligator mississippiensis TaxID=8496 RepID=A0A151P9F8_ALLMI|nr:hypothetical protein Y1Q_0021344 [Alligator mississippiensis]